MAYQSRRNKRKVKIEEQCQYFVTEARTHPNGFTVYKVTCKVATPGSFDCFKESIIWKRYSDFKELYTVIASLHKKLYLNGKVPSFAKPKLFGRFEESVISERRQSAQELLDFITLQPALLKSAVFREFFVGRIPINTSNEIKYLKQSPLKPTVKTEQTLESDSTPEAEKKDFPLSAGDLEIFDPYLSTKEFIESTSTRQDEHWIEQVKKVFSSSQEVHKNPATSPVVSDADEDLDLVEALEIEFTQSELENYYKKKYQVLTASEQPIIPDTSNEQLLSELSIATVNSNVSVSGDQGGSDCTDQAAMEMKTPKLFEIERAQHRKSSKASAYLEAIQKLTESTANKDIQGNLGSSGEDQNVIGTVGVNGDHASSENENQNLISDKTNLATAIDVVKDQCFDDDERGAYLSQAAQQISFARTAEKKEAYEEAFGHYKAAINTLLQGVQGDTDESRIQAVRRKTATYLKHAETLHATHLKTTFKNSDLWKLESNEMKSASPKATELTRSRLNTNSPVVPSPRHKSEDLSIYKVLGAIGKVLLVLDTRNNESYVFKILPKSCKNRLRKGVIPTNVPFMVRLHRYYSTDNAVCLLIEHAAGGRLWDQLASYFETAKRKNESAKPLPKPLDLNSIRRNESSTPIKILPNVSPEKEKGECEEISDKEEQCSSFLDLCMEYRTVECSEAIDTKHTLLEDESEQFNDNPEHLPLTEIEILDDNVAETHVTTSRSLSCLSWDEGSLHLAETTNEATDKDLVFSEKESSETPGDEVNILNFKSVSSTSDIRLFTIDPEDSDTLEDSIYDIRSVEGSDADNSSDEQLAKEEFIHELLSEQDMSAVSLLGDNIDKTLNMPEQLLESNTVGHSSSPLPPHISEICKGSPCLSMNSSFEGTGDEDNCVEVKVEDGDDKKVLESSAVTRVVDEHGVSSVDAVSLFRTHSRTKSLDHSKSVSAALQMDNRTVIKNKDQETMTELSESLNLNLTVGGLCPLVENNVIHSIFIKMDDAKEKYQAYRIPETTIRMWAAELVVAVGTLHSIGILCRDLNPDNILLSADGHIRLSYFGKWKQVERQPSDVTAIKRMYVAPEINKVGIKKTEACDWWSVGGILYELFTAQPLYMAHPSGVTSHTILLFPDDLSPEAKSLLTGLLQYHPQERLGYGVKGLDDLMDHPFFAGVEWEFLIEDYVGS